MLLRVEARDAARLGGRERRVHDRQRRLRVVVQLRVAVEPAGGLERRAQVLAHVERPADGRVRLRHDLRQHVVADGVEVAAQRQRRGRQRARRAADDARAPLQLALLQRLGHAEEVHLEPPAAREREAALLQRRALRPRRSLVGHSCSSVANACAGPARSRNGRANAAGWVLRPRK